MQDIIAALEAQRFIILSALRDLDPGKSKDTHAYLNLMGAITCLETTIERLNLASMGERHETTHVSAMLGIMHRLWTGR